MKMPTTYEVLEKRYRSLLRQEELIVEVTEALAQQLDCTYTAKVELASRLGKSKSYVSQLLSGGRNLTLRTLADVADALDARVKITLEADQESAAHPAWNRSKVVSLHRRAPLGQSREVHAESDLPSEALAS